MSEFERPELADAAQPLTVDDVRGITYAATPHFSLQIRNRLQRLIEPLPASDPARLFAQSEIARLEKLSTELEHGPKNGPRNGSDLPTLHESR